ncbi:MAG TPA: methyl-accepting chemotaxis protein [Zoogloea sp.]|uniref:methyl-accepting chemotaxis protein n=1 Tax=Zoogloea sp. TaxID=49181 RepID=UPI002CE44940|nr:methyl-accepting chemotaxis protein [Zoogloea sp.]HMV16776.1 methyl-accepting chemotaxis protein [Rhodocyclaceae bacterium]HMZ74643.1 methyl-accepting chemotaxis protein [Rhodocyclaceae bacterium]HNB63750.1 methyl-accepting chemotaxis protein [Rhodocyclaceae bacterium]HNC77927.1 methyl-accepting chemotaxis protein [Rhodocyclaceae bacterium]HND23409.1 methyl-accepting chemotaxis protein [Rhodocyclaceae bacterium]
MHLLFAPAVALLNRMRYRAKFALLGALAFAVVLFLLGQLAFSLRESMHFTEAERSALGVVPRLLTVIQLTQQHRGLSAGVLNGNEGMRIRLTAKTGELGEAMKKVDAIALGADASIPMARWGEVKSAWEVLRANGLNLPPKENLTAHSRLVAMEVLALHDLGDDGNLTLDPVADTYYLIDNLLKRVPEVTERLGRLRALGTGVLAAKSLDEQKRYDISVQLGELDMAVEALNENFDRAIRFNPALKGSLGALRDGFNAGTGKVLDQLQNHVLKGDFEMAPQAYFDLVTQAIDIAYAKTFGELIPATDELLAARIAGHQRSFAIDLVVAVLVILVLAYLSGATYVSVNDAVTRLSNGAESLANGDLSTRIGLESRDELGDVAERFNAMAAAFSEVIRKVQQGADAVAGSSVSLAGSAARVSDGSEQQSAAASSMAAAVEEMTVGIEEIAVNAASAEGVSSESGKLSQEGGAVVARTVSEMERIADAVQESARVIQELGDQSAQISTIVNSIKEIADQTNLLALNAAIEAARAGETGRGFAVVADEVRKLAERTAKATEEITTMVASIQAGTGKAVDTMQDGVRRVQEGVQLAGQAGISMDQIRSGAGRVVTAVTDISAALREQGVASTEIARNVERIAQMAEQNSAAVRDTAGTARELERLAQQLRGDVQRFRI